MSQTLDPQVPNAGHRHVMVVLPPRSALTPAINYREISGCQALKEPLIWVRNDITGQVAMQLVRA